jgi:hypothetical protein
MKNPDSPELPLDFQMAVDRDILRRGGEEFSRCFRVPIAPPKLEVISYAFVAHIEAQTKSDEEEIIAAILALVRHLR